MVRLTHSVGQAFFRGAASLLRCVEKNICLEAVHVNKSCGKAGQGDRDLTSFGHGFFEAENTESARE